jgi:hypothetical protein
MKRYLLAGLLASAICSTAEARPSCVLLVRDARYLESMFRKLPAEPKPAVCHRVRRALDSRFHARWEAHRRLKEGFTRDKITLAARALNGSAANIIEQFACSGRKYLAKRYGVFTPAAYVQDFFQYVREVKTLCKRRGR